MCLLPDLDVNKFFTLAILEAFGFSSWVLSIITSVRAATIYKHAVNSMVSGVSLDSVGLDPGLSWWFEYLDIGMKFRALRDLRNNVLLGKVFIFYVSFSSSKIVILIGPTS